MQLHNEQRSGETNRQILPQDDKRYHRLQGESVLPAFRREKQVPEPRRQNRSLCPHRTLSIRDQLHRKVIEQARSQHPPLQFVDCIGAQHGEDVPSPAITPVEKTRDEEAEHMPACADKADEREECVDLNMAFARASCLDFPLAILLELARWRGRM